jgi:hypothetical protein
MIMNRFDMESRPFSKWLKYEPTKLDIKIKYFEYFVKQLIADTKDLEDLHSRGYSVLKVNQLLFLACSANIKLLDIFDNWYATPYGPKEEDIHKYIRLNEGRFSFFTLSSKGIKLEINGNK